ncbi:hypothetical protein [Paenibacillus sp. GP183]|uniref:hypothetical protein n=1 Tax=Paenibacillus sp. GP183 TaxID=1882751 RepID=UPI000896617F|nr:hypothetical protein [Paenibacillus sp. GP183]SEC18128.1 hypothetical protein SAMN05443246_3246 [Paenibacillus sp. GP183]
MSNRILNVKNSLISVTVKIIYKELLKTTVISSNLEERQLYRIVKSDEDMEIFNRIWMENWSNKGYDIEPYQGIATRFIILNDCNLPAATIEIVHYNPEKKNFKKTSTIEDWFCFSENEIVKRNRNLCCEIDKVSISKEYNGQKILDRILNLLFHFAEKNNVKYYLALIESIFFRTLKFYKVPIIKLGEAVTYSNGSKFIPSMIDVEYGIEHKERFDWFMHNNNETEAIYGFTT